MKKRKPRPATPSIDRKTNLPPELVKAKRGTRKGAADGHKEKFFKKETDLNPNGKEDFDSLLDAMLNEKEPLD